MIINADILEWAASYDGPLFHALLCDPPYHLTEIVKRFGKPGSAPAQPGTDGAFQRASKGFMGRSWDGGDLAFQPETWGALANLLHPGAFLMAFAGSRGYHRMACAIEDAGLIIHPAIGWVFGSGFPKATRVDAQIDEDAFQRWLTAHDEERIILDRFHAKVQECRQSHRMQPTATSRALVTAAHNAYRRQHQEIKAAAGFLRTNGTKKHQPKFAAKDFGYREKDNGYNSRDRESFDVTAPATELAAAWQGHRYGLQAMKPAFEFICVAQKPYQSAPVECITSTGAGALWIDGGRIGASDGVPVFNQKKQDSAGVYGNGLHGSARTGEVDTVTGRWPANLILSHSPDCNGVCAPDCPVRRLGEQSGESESKRSDRGKVEIFDELYKRAPSWHGESTERGHNDSSTAARFFFQVDYMAERLEAADPLFYCPKADRSEREAGLDPRQIALLGMEEVEGQAHRSAAPPDRRCRTCGGWCPTNARRRPGSTCTCDEPDFTFVDFAESTINDGRQKSIDNPYQRGETTRRNIHPCQKPLSLTRYLATLLLPPAMYAPRRLLVPFSGAASEYIGAVLAGWEEIVGIEIEADYCRIAEARAAYWTQRRHEFLDPAKPIEVKASAAPDGQRDMFLEDL